MINIHFYRSLSVFLNRSKPCYNFSLTSVQGGVTIKVYSDNSNMDLELSNINSSHMRDIAEWLNGAADEVDEYEKKYGNTK